MNLSALRTVCCIVGCLAGSFLSTTTIAATPDMSPEELEKWFNSDKDIVDPIKLINEGDLVFLKQKPDKEPHQAMHKITILPSSLKDGWVTLSQCHVNLDVMPAAQVVF